MISALRVFTGVTCPENPGHLRVHSPLLRLVQTGSSRRASDAERWSTRSPGAGHPLYAWPSALAWDRLSLGPTCN